MKNCTTLNLPLKLVTEEWLPIPDLRMMTTDVYQKGYQPGFMQRHPEIKLGYTPHYHDFHELVTVTIGHAVHVIDGKRYPVSCGDVYVIRPGVVHYFDDHSADFFIFDIGFMPEELPLPLEALKRIPGYNMLMYYEPAQGYPDSFKSRLHLDAAGMDKYMRLATSLKGEMLAGDIGYEARSIALLTEILVHLGRCYNDTKDDQPGGRLQRLSRALAYMHTNYSTNLSLPEIARMANCSPRAFQRDFLQIMGTHPTEYLRQMRLEAAADLLQRTNRSIEDIATATGFNSRIYFCQAFRKKYDCTPTHYRNGAHAPMSEPTEEKQP